MRLHPVSFVVAGTTVLPHDPHSEIVVAPAVSS